VKQFRNTHHRLAQLFAMGLSRKEISQITGLSYTRLATHENDPAFRELITKYEPDIIQARKDRADEFAATEFESAMCAARLKHRKLHDTEDALEAGEDVKLPAFSELLAITSDFGDRFGYSKQSRQTNEVFDFAKILEAQMSRMGKATVIDAVGHHTASGLEGKGLVPESPPTQPSRPGESQFSTSGSGQVPAITPEQVRVAGGRDQYAAKAGLRRRI